MDPSAQTLLKRKLTCDILDVMSMILRSSAGMPPPGIPYAKLKIDMDNVHEAIIRADGLGVPVQGFYDLMFNVYDHDPMVKLLLEYLAYKNLGAGYCDALKAKWKQIDHPVAAFEIELIIKLYYDRSWSEGIVESLIDPEFEIRVRWEGFFGTDGAEEQDH